MRVQTPKPTPVHAPWMWDENEWETTEALIAEVEAERKAHYVSQYEFAYLSNGDEE